MGLTETERLWTKNFILLSLSNMFLFIGFEMLLPILPVYVAHYGGNNLEIGLIMGIFTISAILIRPFTGKVSTFFGNQRLLLLGILICLLTTGFYYMAVTVYFVMFVRILHGFGFGISTTLYGSMASNMVPPSRRGEGMGYFGLGSTLAYALGPFLGVWLINSYSFFISFGVSVVSLLLAFIFTMKISCTESGAVEETKGSLFSNMIEPRAIFPSLLCLLLGFSYGGIIGFLVLFGMEANITNVGWYFLTNALSVFAIRPIAGRWFDQKGHPWVLIPGSIFCLIGLVVLSGASTVQTLIFAAVFYGLGEGAIFPSLQAWVVNRVAPDRRITANATFFNAFDLGICGGAILLGMVAEATSYSAMYLYSGISMVMFLMIYTIYIFNEGKKQKQAANHSY